jgi:tetratricopeptide (TPR) repeat protein
LLNEEDVPWRTYELLGRIELEQDHYAAAAEYFQKIIDLNAKNRIGWVYKGLVLAETDSADAIEAHYRQALKYLPDDPLVLSFHGISLNRLGRQEEALVPLEKALKIDPYNLNALVSYGLTLNQLNRNHEAIKPLENARMIDSTNITVLSTLGMIYDDLKMYSTCDSLYEAALKFHPESHLLLNNYAYSLAERSKRLEFALKMVQKAVASQPQNGAYLDTMGWIYYKLGNYDLALKYVEESLANRENSPVVVEHLGDIYLKLGDSEQAVTFWRRAIEMNGNRERLEKKIEKR